MTRSIHVLHVDDEPDFAEMAGTFLEREDSRFDIETTTSSDQALDRLAEDRFDCVVSDYDMPGRNGVEFLKAVREEYSDLPFILFTGKGSEEIASEAISAGATDYLQKESGTDQYKVLANRVTNVYERYQTAQDLVETTELYETMLSNISETVLITDDEGSFTYICPNVHFVFGYSAADIEDFEVVDSLFEEQLFDQEELRTDGVISNIETEITNKSGERRTVLVTVKRVSIKKGTRLYTVRDITDRKERRRKLQRNEARYESLTSDVLDTSAVGTFILDSTFEVIWINKATEKYFGIDRDVVLGTDKRELIQSEIREIFEDPEQFTETVLATYDDNTYTEEFECHVFAGNGREERWLRHWSQPITSGLYEGGRIEHYTDITERKQRELDLQEKERRYQAIFNDPNILVGLLDVDGTVLDINKTAMEYIDIDLAEITGTAFWQTPWFTGDEVVQDEVKELIERARTGEYVEFELDLSRAVGDRLVINGVFRPVIDDDGEVVSLLISDRDITERKLREERLRRQNEQFDEIAGVVSHDLHTPLETARGRAELALETGGSEHIEKTLAALERADELRADLVEMLRGREIVSEASPVDLTRLADEIWETMEPPEGATLRVKTPPRVVGDVNALRRLLENVFSNSIEHVGSGVAIEIGECRSGFYIEDDGQGIDPETREEIFTPGFSTKPEGTGMGMTSVQQIVLAHGWEIHVTSSVADGGARFEITGVEFTTE
jgi:PAS domain S-box-containing protein